MSRYGRWAIGLLAILYSGLSIWALVAGQDGLRVTAVVLGFFAFLLYVAVIASVDAVVGSLVRRRRVRVPRRHGADR